MPSPKAARVRAKMPKVKTGCRTCKIRRVKCDERRPACQRCTRFGIGCDGYPDQPSASESRALMPRKTGDGGTALSNSAPPRRSIALPPFLLNSRNPFESQAEYQYFRHFRDEITVDLAGGFDPSLWHHVILQACETEPPLRELAVSIAALSKASSTTNHTDPDLQYALRKYGKALHHIRDTIKQHPTSPTSIRLALISSILIYCIENLHGLSTTASIAHLEAALRLLRKRLSLTNRPYQHRLSTSPTPDLEDDLLKAMVRLDSSLQGRPDNPNPPAGNILGIYCTTELYDPPDFFTGTEDARRYLEHLGFRAMAHLPHDIPTDLIQLPPTSADFAVLEGIKPTFVPARAFDAIGGDLQRWMQAFTPVWESAQLDESHDSFLPAAILRIQAVNLAMHLRISLRGVQTFADTVIPEAEEVVGLAGRLVRHKGFRRGFVLENGIVSALFIVLFTPQVRKTRVQALEVLRAMEGRREGVWDARMVRRLGEWVLGVGDEGGGEEEGVGDGGSEGGSGSGSESGSGSFSKSEGGSETKATERSPRPAPEGIEKLGWWVMNLVMASREAGDGA